MGQNCKRNSWIAAVVLGILVFLIALPGFFWALVLGIVVALVLGYVLTNFVCKDEDAAGSAEATAVSPAATAQPVAPSTTTPDAATSTPTSTTSAAKSPPSTPEPAAPQAPETAPAEPEAPTPEPVAATPQPDPTPPAPAAPATPAETPATGDAEDEGTKPAGLSAARDGTPDDLRQIKGVGPKLNTLLNELGIYHFDQIAGWTEAEIAWMDSNLKGFKGRVTRDNWVEQAGQLARGEATEFSARVGKGDVY